MMDVEIAKILDLNAEKTIEETVQLIHSVVREASAEGVVIGLSGGVDSSVVATLCTKAIGSNKVLGILMPTQFTPKEDIEDAQWLVDWLSIEDVNVPIDPITQSIFQLSGIRADEPDARIAMANVRARVRMVILYYHANYRHLLVAGTGDRSEFLLGYFTKYGDGGVDFLPIGHLYKTQVRKLAVVLGLPPRIAYKASSPQLWPGHRARDELPAGYEELDPALVALFDLKMQPDEVSRVTGLSKKVVDDIVERYQRSAHKRRFPKTIG